MKNKWFKSSIAIQIYIGLAILVLWSIITTIYSYMNGIDWFSGLTYLWNVINIPVGLGWLIIILIVYTFLLIRYFYHQLKRNHLSKTEVLNKLSDKVNCSTCDSSWEVLFAQISPYHPMHDFYTSDEYYLNRFKDLIWFGLRKKPSPDYYDIEHGIDGLIEVIKHKQSVSDTQRDEILDTLNECDENQIKSKKEKLVDLINRYHR